MIKNCSALFDHYPSLGPSHVTNGKDICNGEGEQLLKGGEHVENGVLALYAVNTFP